MNTNVYPPNYQPNSFNQGQQQPQRPYKMIYIILGVIFGILVIGGGFSGCSTYNSLVGLEEAMDQNWAEVQNQYQRRFDLIPNLVSTVNGYAQHESRTFENVTLARAGLQDALDNAEALRNENTDSQENFDRINQSQSELNRQLNLYVNAVHEAYPELKADRLFKDLTSQLEGTENRVAVARMRYTEAVKDYNLKVRRFPASVWAGMFGFEKRPQFSADTQAQSAPRVEFPSN